MLRSFPKLLANRAPAKVAILVLALALIVSGIPLADSDVGPSAHLVRRGDEIFVVTTAPQLHSAGAAGHEATTLVIHRGIPAGSRSLLQVSESTASDAGSFEYLEAVWGDPFTGAARWTSGAVAWEELIAVDLSSDESTVFAEYRVGQDTVSLAVPRSWAESTSEVIAEVTVNGQYGELHLDGGLAAALADPQSTAAGSADLGFVLNDVEGFVAAVGSYTSLHATVSSRSAVTLGAKDDDDGDGTSGGDVTLGGCGIPCLRCVGAFLGTIGSLIAIVAACGATVASGGIAAAACVGAFIGHNVAAMALMTSCASCGECL